MIYKNDKFLVFILCYLFFGVESFIPTGRVGHSSVLVDNKLYFFGGRKNDGFNSNEVFYLDVSQSFKLEVPPWNDLTTNAGVPFKSSWGAVSFSGIDQTIYLFGGYMDNIATNNDAFVSIIYSFNLTSLSWNIPIIKGNLPARRINIKGVMDNTGNIYIFGGIATQNLQSNFFNDMVTLNTVESLWSISTTVGIPKISEYTATLLPNDMIVYIGGYNDEGDLDINQINLYNTKSSTWSMMTAKFTDQIGNRSLHTAVLTPDGKIIIYGGVDVRSFQATPTLAVLNTNTEPYEWTIPRVSSNVDIFPSLSSHTANLVGNYMIVALGEVTQPNNPPLTVRNSNIYLLDIRNYTWVNSFEVIKPNNNSSNSIHNNAKAIIAAVFGVLGNVIIMVVGFLIYRRYQRRKNVRNVDKIPGTGYDDRNLPGDIEVVT